MVYEIEENQRTQLQLGIRSVIKERGVCLLKKGRRMILPIVWLYTCSLLEKTSIVHEI